MIDVINLKKSFGDVEVLTGIDITINKGDIVAVIGPSGSGKSTFLRCLNCMEDPTGGSIIFNGVDIADMSVDINVHRRHMGMVFQHFNLFNNKTVLQNIMLAPVHLKCQDLKKAKKKNRMIQFKNTFSSQKTELIPITQTEAQIKEEAKEHAIALLRRIGLEDKADVYPSTLSITFPSRTIEILSPYRYGLTGDHNCGSGKVTFIVPLPDASARTSADGLAGL